MNINAIKKVKDFRTLAYFLSQELNWPFDPESVDVDDLVFDYTADEIGLNEEFANMVNSIQQIQPLNPNQPWSIFWIDFKNKRLPLTVLRRILNVFVTKKRAKGNNLATKALEDIMFVSGNGVESNRAITFAHFKKLDNVETIREFYWDQHETQFNGITTYLESLKWPTNTTDVDAWREKWKGAFTGSTREAISSSKELAIAMAAIAKNIRGRVLEVLSIELENGPVHKLYDTFRIGLVHDMTENGFADMYAQTITYGLFSARTMDLDGHFELHEVIDLIPQTNPFLKTLFKECLQAGDAKHKINLDELGVSKLVDLFDSLNREDGTDTMQRILAEFGRQTHNGTEDPVIHFYEDFLGEYDKTQKVEKGVFYTPDPVVSFIVRSVNEQLKSEFGLEMGLADTTTWADMVHTGRAEYPVDPKTGKLNNEWKEQIKNRAFVQILDPATGTGTFIKHVIEVIHEEVDAKYKREKPKTDWLEYWNIYVYRNLLPRIYGFELMMASYTVAHMKIGMYLKSLGYKFEKDQRLNIYLTNSLEPHTANMQVNFFVNSVGVEAAGANNIKQNRYFSVVLGNPPYSVSSSNKGKWIRNLINDYKKELNEKKINLDDDYIKFIRFGQNLIQQNRIGILAYISNNSFIDGITHRQMRKHLLESFDKIYIYDLHGSAKKKEVCFDGSPDQNVFDIMQGVSINIFVKTDKKINKVYSQLLHSNLQGKRENKYKFLNDNDLNKLSWNKLDYSSPNYFFMPNSMDADLIYDKGFKLDNLFIFNNTGIQTKRDALTIQFNEKEIQIIFDDLLVNGLTFLINKYKIREDGRDWRLAWAIQDLKNNNPKIEKILYRPFDVKYTLYTGKSKGFIAYPRHSLNYHIINRDNISLSLKRQSKFDFSYVFIHKLICESCLFESAYANNSEFPLYLYSEPNEKSLFGLSDKRKPNLKTEIVKQISDSLGLEFTNEKGNNKNTFAPQDLLDYIYSILHSPKYREKFKEFLRIDFPRIPYPIDQDIFWRLVKLGGELRQIHLLESDVVNDFITQYPINGDDVVTKKASYEDGKVWISKTQYFDHVPQVAWEFYIGGYQPAQKWLKDRKDRELSSDDISHYQKIIVALTETYRIMKEIDKIEIE